MLKISIYFPDTPYGAVVRPAVVLRSDMLVITNSASTYEPGTRENPYVVQ